MPPAGYQQFISNAANAYGINPKVLDKVAEYESGRRPVAQNNTDINAINGTPSKGMFQFIDPTFVSYSKEARKANPQAWKGIPTRSSDWRAQALTTSWAIKNGKGKAWATYDRAKRDAKTSDFNAVTPTQTSQAAGNGAWSAPQKAALGMIFKDNPTMQNIIGIKIKHDDATVISPTKQTQGVAGGGDVGSQLVTTALSQVGKTTADAMKYIKAAGGTGKEPWCGDFVQWVFKQQGLTPPPARSVPRLLSWAKQNQKLIKNPRQGDLVIFDWNKDGKPDHVEIVTQKTKTGVKAVGGNTGGGKVAKNDRASNIMGYIAGY